MKISPTLSRRRILGACGGLITVQMASPSRASTLPAKGPSPDLVRRATQAFQRQGGLITSREVVAIADFSAPSREPRFHLIDMVGGKVTTLLVAHGRGSDPAHSGWVERFSNAPGSMASSAGAYLVGADYVGKHGQSRRLIGLDPDNSNAEARAIVIHAAAYVGAGIIRQQGKLGRSEGCFAVSDTDLRQVLDRLAPGSLLYADKL
jgi:hypothetical protein